MKIISISWDKKILISGSESQQRQKKYGRLCDEFHIVVLGTEKVVSHKISDSTWIHSTSSQYKFLYLFDAVSVAKLIGRADLVTAQDPGFAGFVAYVIAKIFRCKLHIQIHIDFFSSYFKKESLSNRVYFILAKFLLPRADGIRCVSKKIKNHLVVSMGLKENVISVVPVYTDIHKIISTDPVQGLNLHIKYPLYSFIIFMASRLVKQKNIEMALSSFRDLKSRYPSIGIVIVGSGPESDRLRKIAQSISEDIVFEPWNDHLSSYFKTSDAFLLSSNYEGWGRTVIEAMASGCPVVMPDVGAANEVLFDGVSGFIFPVGDKAELVKKLARLIDESELRNLLAQNALVSIQTLSSEEEYLSHYLKSWQNCFS